MSDHSLPGILGVIADVAGKDAAYAILQARGGTRVTFPAAPSETHWLTKLVGAEAAMAICDHFAQGNPSGGRTGMPGSVDIPLHNTSLQKAARRRIADELRAGKSASAAAREAGVHERTAWRVKAKLRDDNQGELF